MCDKNKFPTITALLAALGTTPETLKEFCQKNNILYTVHDASVPPYKKEDLDKCCGTWTPGPIVADASCCAGAQEDAIDCEKPISVLQSRTGKPSKSQVRLLARGVRCISYPGHTCLVAVTGANADILVYVNPRTGEGRSVRHGVRWKFCNTPELPVNRTEVVYLNLYSNPDPNNLVIESFDTRKQADDGNIFVSRDCCIKLTAARTDGVWSTAATIESQ